MGSSAGTQRYSVHSETRLPLAQPACVLWACWNTVYVQMRHWAERGVLAAVFERLRDRGGLVASDTEMAMMLDSTSVKVHADGTGSLKKTVRKVSAARAEG